MLHIKNRVFWGYVSQMTLIPILNCMYGERAPQEEVSADKRPHIIQPTLNLHQEMHRSELVWAVATGTSDKMITR